MTKKFENILEAISVQCSIMCYKCMGYLKEESNDEYLFAEQLIKEGWTFKNDLVICSDCAKKSKKTNKGK